MSLTHRRSYTDGATDAEREMRQTVRRRLEKQTLSRGRRGLDLHSQKVDSFEALTDVLQ